VTMPCAMTNGVCGAFRLDWSTTDGPNPTTQSRIMNNPALM
jgi:hypothetical protein